MAGKGGKTPGAGRKSKAEELGLAELIQSAISDDDWREIFKTAARKAKDGSLPHAEFVAAYYFGKPKQILDVTSKGQAIKGYAVLGPTTWDEDNSAVHPSTLAGSGLEGQEPGDATDG